MRQAGGAAFECVGASSDIDVRAVEEFAADGPTGAAPENCSSSVEPLSAVFADFPPAIT